MHLRSRRESDKNLRRRITLLLALALAALAAPAWALANDCVWAGATSTDWTEPSNWTTCGLLAPQSADTATVSVGGAFLPAIPGAASVAVAGLTINAGVILEVDGTLELGNLTGIGQLKINGTLNWSSGSMTGSGTTLISSGGALNISGAGLKQIMTRSIINSGTITWTGAGSIDAAFTTFQNAASGIFDMQSDAGFTSFAYMFLNSGTLKKSAGAGTSSFQATLKNFGTVVASSGTLALNGLAGSSADGTFQAATGATLAFAAGTQTLSASSSVSGSGTVLFSGADVQVLGAYTVSGTTAITGGSVSFGAPATTAALEVSGGTLQGLGTLTVTGSCQWTGGAMAEAGVTAIASPATLTISGSEIKTLSARTIQNAGSAIWSGTGDVEASDGAIILNLAGATFDIQNDRTIHSDSGSATPTFRNAGVTKKTTALSLTSSIATFFDNSGTVEVDDGVLFFGSYTQTGGTTVLNGGSIRSSSPINLQGGTMTGSGLVLSNVVNSGTIAPGPLPSTIEIRGDFSQTTQGTLSLDLDGTGAGEFDQLKVTGAVALAGAVAVTAGFSPAAGDAFPIVLHDAGESTAGSFAGLPDGGVLPSGGTNYRVRYQAAGTDAVRLTVGAVVAAAAVSVDAVAGAGSDGNGIFEPGETAPIVPSWKNWTASGVALTGAASAFAGPVGPTYTIADSAANYGTIGADATAACSNCYALSIAAASRPTTHWDATFTETPGTTDPAKVWTLHVGDSFSDVPRTQPFYKRIEALLHNAITSGCAAGKYCPGDPVSRSQMAIFIAKAMAGGAAQVSSSGSAGTQGYFCTAGGTSIFLDVAPEDSFCRHVHYLAVQNVTLGCGSGNYCPNTNINRSDMAIFIAKAIVAPQGGPGVPVTYGPDPETGLSYSCDAGSPSLHFTDVSPSDSFCKHVHYLWARGIISGCSASAYCPTDGVTRDAMAKFLGNAFHLALYGP